MAEERIAGIQNPEKMSANSLKQYWAAFVASLGGFALGVCLGWNSSTSVSLKNYVNADSLLLGLVGGIFNLGVCVSLLLLPMILRVFSRVGAMLITLPVLLLGWSCIAFAGQTVSLLILGRILCGFSGTFCVLTPIYVAEIAERRVRGRLLVLFQLLMNLGVMFAYTLAHFTANEKTIWLYSLSCALTTAPVALAVLIPETPAYHILVKGDELRARMSVEFFRGKDSAGIDAEIEELKRVATFRKSKRVSCSTLREKRVIRSLAASLGVMITYQFSGISPFTFYTLEIFKHTGPGELSASIQTLIVGGAQIGGSLVAAIAIDTLGRKPLLIASSGLMGISIFLLGWYSTVEQEDPKYADELSWMPLTWMALFFGAFSLGVGPIAWVYLGEAFPWHVRLESAIGMAFLNWLAALAFTLLFGEMSEGMGESGIMWFFAGFSFLGMLFGFFFIDETRLLSLTDIRGEETRGTVDDTPTQSQ